MISEEWPDEVVIAVDALHHLQQVAVPPIFAARLELQIRARARALHQAETRQERSRFLPRLTPIQRRLVAIASVLLALVLAGGVVASAAARSLPGDWLYGLRQWSNQIALSQASTPAAKAEVAIQQLHGALRDLRTEVSDHRSDANIGQALTEVVHATQQAQSAVAAIPAGMARTSVQTDLAQTLGEESTTLHQLLVPVNWPNKVAMTTQLGALGDAIPQITSVTVSATGKGLLGLTIQGQHFVQGAQVVVDGKAIGGPQTVTATELTITIPVALWDGHDHRVGMLNPDGTAAEVQVARGNQGQSKGNPHATPVPEATPDNGNEHHNTHLTPGS